MIPPLSSYTAQALPVSSGFSERQQTESGNAAGQATTGKVEDRITLSPEATESSRAEGKTTATSSTPDSANEQQSALTAEELKQLSQLKSRDREVRSHEQAHLSVAGQYARGGASFTLEKGPDGNSYAIGGEVPIDVSAESEPEATIQKMRVIRRAALAPADPSSTDRQIAADASAKELRARQEIAAKLQDKMSNVLSSQTEQQNKELADRSPSSPTNAAEDSAMTRKAMIAAYQKFSAS
jgi:hypothetical protein